MIILKKNIQEKRLGEDEEITPEEMNFISTFSRLAEMIDETPSKKLLQYYRKYDRSARSIEQKGHELIQFLERL